jgi:kinesin family protein 20
MCIEFFNCFSNFDFRFSFCDLAGAERAKHTQNVGERLRESQNINTSLHVLGRCLMTIR